MRTLNEQEEGIDRCQELRANLQKYKIDICCLAETKLMGKGEREIGGWRLLYSGIPDVKSHGVGIMLSERALGSLIGCDRISERLMSCSFALPKSKLHVVSAYAPTNDKDESVKESFYAALQQVISGCPKRDMLMIVGDFNAQLGGQDRSLWDGALGKFCLPSTVTDNGTKLLSLCAANQLVVRNTFFQQKSIHLGSWVSPAGNAVNQIDHFLVRRSEAKYVHNCKVFRGTTLESDHYLIRAECHLPPHCFQAGKVRVRQRLNTDKLDDAETSALFRQQIDAAYRTHLHTDCQTSWIHFRDNVQRVQTELLLEQETTNHEWLTAETRVIMARKQAAWLRLCEARMNEKKSRPPVSVTGKRNAGQVPNFLGPQGEKDIEKKSCTPCDSEKSRGAASGPPLEATSLGGLQCGSSPNCGVASPTVVKSNGLAVTHAQHEYRTAKNAARKAVTHDKRQHWQRIASKLEQHFKKGDLHAAYRTVRLRTETDSKTSQIPESMKRADGTHAIGRQQNALLKKQYFSELLNVSRVADPDLDSIVPSSQSHFINCSPPTLEETRDMIEKLKNHKAAGIDEIPAEVLKWGGKSITAWLHEIILGVWESERAPAEWKQALIVPVFKSGDKALLDNYRGISLLSIPAKVYSLIIGERLKKWADEHLLDVQSGFRPERGCADAIFSLRRLQEEALNKQRNMFTCFIDLSKAYDSIPRALAWDMLARRGVPCKIISLLRDLHTDTWCALKGDHKSAASWFEVKTGFKQGDVNAPMLFNLFIDTVVRCLEPLLGQAGVTFTYRIDGQLTHSKTRNLHEIAWILMFADDIALIMEDGEQMESALQQVDHTFSQWGLDISFKKTKVMPLLPEVRADYEGSHLSIQRGQIEFVSQFKYLGSIDSVGLLHQPEVGSRLAKAGGAFHRLVRLWGDRHISRQTKLSVYKAVVQATLLYGCESWAVPLALIASLDTFQMRCLRRICGISLRQKRTSKSIRAECGIEAISNIARFRRLRWLGHVARMKDDRLPKRLLFSSLSHLEQTERRPGRLLKSWPDYVREDLRELGIAYHWFRLAQDRDKWRDSIFRLLEHT